MFDRFRKPKPKKKRGPKAVKPANKEPHPTIESRYADGRLKPGYSGNPNGRPLLGKTLAERYRAALDELLDPENPEAGTIGNAIIRLSVIMALDGNLEALKYAEARGFGKLPDVVELKHDEGDEINFDDWSEDDLKAYEILLKRNKKD